MKQLDVDMRSPAFNINDRFPLCTTLRCMQHSVRCLFSQRLINFDLSGGMLSYVPLILKLQLDLLWLTYNVYSVEKRVSWKKPIMGSMQQVF